jgi:curved DNA-binding protein
MEFIDYYKLLGVSKSASAKEIKNAYRKLARKFHPDLNPNDKDAKKKFQEINEAHEVLSDPAKRQKYDQYGKDWNNSDQFEKQRQQWQQTTGSQRSWNTESQSFNDFSDFFETLFGESFGPGRARQARSRGEDLQAQLQLALIEAYKSHQRTLNVNDKKIRITIPAGIENGQTIKIPGHGGKGKNGGPNGDLYITFSINKDPDFERLGNDLYTTVEIDLYTAVLGGAITIDTLDGKVKLKVKPGTQNGTRVKLKDKGFPVYKMEGQFGDMYLTYSVRIPTNLTDKHRKLFTQLSEL